MENYVVRFREQNRRADLLVNQAIDSPHVIQRV